MNTLYLDIFSGISGDMFIGALLDLGVDATQLERQLRALNLAGYHLHVSKQERSGIAGTKFDVHLEEDHHHTHGDQHSDAHHHGHGGHDHKHATQHAHPHESDDDVPSPAQAHAHAHGRSFADISELIESSGLSAPVKKTSAAIFRRIAVAEGKVHGMPPEQVHFHEVGAIDSIVDIVGACIALELLGNPRVLAGPAVEGTGFVMCAHGRFPLPAPATLEILGARGILLSQCEEPGELITPTGAAILAELAESHGPMRDLQPKQVGYGLGTRHNQTRPNVLRAILADAGPSDSDAWDWERDTVSVLETNLDDISPEILGGFLDRALAAGALDVFHTPIQMKKSRPGVLLTVLCPTREASRFAAIMLEETSAFGLRETIAERRKLRREIRRVPTAHGEVEIKAGFLNGRIVQWAPEYESCRRLADEYQIPIKDIFDAARRAKPRD